MKETKSLTWKGIDVMESSPNSPAVIKLYFPSFGDSSSLDLGLGRKPYPSPSCKTTSITDRSLLYFQQKKIR
jgi:hypothetical protein